MQLGFIGLGKMGQNMVLNLLKKNHKVIVYDKNEVKYKDLYHHNLTFADSIRDFCLKLKNKPKIIWLMVPSNNDALDKIIFSSNGLMSYLNKGDIIIDGGNSYFRKTIERAKQLKKVGAHFVDCGCSGGPNGAKMGMSITVGGSCYKVYKNILPILESLAAKDGLMHVGPSGSGHFVKMIHNAIEYGMMESFAEGFELLKRGPYKNLNLAKVARAWNHGSVIQSFLCETIEKFLSKDQNLNNLKPYVDDSGEGKWALIEAVNSDTHFYTLAMALFSRYRSREQSDYALKFLAILRNTFGGHKIYETKK